MNEILLETRDPVTAGYRGVRLDGPTTASVWLDGSDREPVRLQHADIRVAVACTLRAARIDADRTVHFQDEHGRLYVDRAAGLLGPAAPLTGAECAQIAKESRA